MGFKNLMGQGLRVNPTPTPLRGGVAPNRAPHCGRPSAECEAAAGGRRVLDAGLQPWVALGGAHFRAPVVVVSHGPFSFPLQYLS